MAKAGETIGKMASAKNNKALSGGGQANVGGGFSEKMESAKARLGAVPYQSATGAMGSVAGAAADLGVPGAKFAQTMLESVDKLRAWNNHLHESNMHFAEFSSSMALVQAESEARAFQLNREQGEARAESAKELAESKDRLNRQLGPIEDFWANLKNKVGAGLSDMLSGALEQIGLEGKEEMKLKGSTVDSSLWATDLDKLQNESTKRRPKRFAGAGGGDF